MKEMSKTAQIFIRITAFAVLLACTIPAYYSLRLGYGEYLFRSGLPEAVERAVLLTPSARYAARAGHLDQAVQLNPYYSAGWMELGEAAEIRGDPAQAALSLAQAERIDKTFEPAWALANFFFRQERWEDFWKWMRVAAERSYGDRFGFFRLCWRATEDPEIILARAIPHERQILSEYVYFLLTSGRASAARAAAGQLIPLAVQEDVPGLLWLSDLLIEREHDARAALEIWNALIERNWIPLERLTPPAGISLTNASFRVEPSAHGFDWRPVQMPGSRYLWSSTRPGLTLIFDGHQPEQATALYEWLPVEPQSAYEITLHPAGGEPASPSGLSWKVLTPANTTLSAIQFASGATVMRFKTGPADSLVRLVLAYQRPAGSVRMQGRVPMPHVEMRRNP